MRPVWTGALAFGLVNIPVRLHSAVRARERVSFRLLHGSDLSPIHNERVCDEDGETVPWDEIVKGFEYSKGKFVALDDGDFESAALESSRTLEILDFVKAEAIDPRYFETPYYLVPDRGGEKAYALLRAAMHQSGVVGIGKITMRTNALHLAGIKTVGDAILLEIMRFAGELVDASELAFPGESGVRPQELEMAGQLIENLSGAFDPSKYVDDYHENLMKVIRAKLKGKPIEAPAPAERETTRVIDLMDRLQESVAAARGGKGKTRRRTGARKGSRTRTRHRPAARRRTRRTQRESA